MKKEEVDFTKYNNDWYIPNRGILVRTLWYFISIIFFQSYLFPFYKIKIILLKIFGAKIGSGLIIKPSVNIKYPWNLSIGNNVWIGENVWIDNLCEIIIGDNVCISQGAMLLTGNHNYKLKSFDLMVKSIILEDGVWIGARSTVCPNVICKSHSVLSVGSVANKNLNAYTIYQGIPAIMINNRIIH